MIIYRSHIGYVYGHRQGEDWFIDAFVVSQALRGQGLARALAEHLPDACTLLAVPLWNMPGPNLSESALITFYESLGFILRRDRFGNPMMTRSTT